MSLHHDPQWLRAGHWFEQGISRDMGDIGLLGIPAHLTSLSPTQAHLTPAAVRAALMRMSTWSASAGIDVAERLVPVDAGDVEDPDGPEGEARATDRAVALLNATRLGLLLGGDNSITFAGASALATVAGGWERIGVITLDAHHDMRDGVSNGSPIRRLIEAGVDGTRVVQIGISDFANSRAYARRVSDAGITVIHRDEVDMGSIASVVSRALEVAGAQGRAVYVDVDVDVCDRSVAPACPASLPGGFSARELRTFVRALARDARVRAMDVTEVDAARDTADERTVRLVAACVMEAATGLAAR